MIKVSRRSILAASTAIPLAACGKVSAPEDFKAQTGNISETFAHGVASGDMTPSSAIIWTRVSGKTSETGVILPWDISETEEFETTVKSGAVIAYAAADFTAKVDVKDLLPGKTYYFRFKSGKDFSPVGRLKTLPESSLNSLRFAVVSCTNWEAGFFNVYDHIARDDGFDAVLHLGDYFYEYGEGGWGGGAGESIGRSHEPKHELITLADYRARHAQYRTDPNLQAMTARHALLPIWDDHETANDSWTGGAQNHNAGEGRWDARKTAALRAYYEWMPVRTPEGQLEDLYNAYSFGDLLTLVTVETRLSARAEPINIDNYTKDMNGVEDAEAFRKDVLYAPDRMMMDDAQTDFIISEFTKSKAAGQPWRLMGNQVVMGRLHTADLTPHVKEENILAMEVDWPAVRDFVKNSAYGLPIYPDSWDGYPWAREQFYGKLKAAGLTDIVVVTGDAHEFWVNDLTDDAGTKIGVELGTTSVTSPTLYSYFGDDTPDYSMLVTQSNPDVRYYNAMHNGYIDLEFTRSKAEAKLITVDTVLDRDYSAGAVAEFSVKKSGESVKFTSPKGLTMLQRALFVGLG